ncbi:MAG: hypothetical protein CMQ19_14960 [Gammaproteobacteria bacterium]|nr:hypothetical protein [Gammaproteobacteria bacterium]
MVFLGLMGFVLDRAFQRSAEQAIEEKLLIQIYGLLAVSDESNGEIYLPDQLQEPQFNNLGSGLFGLVVGAQGQDLWQSPSALDLQIKHVDMASLHRDLEAGVQKFGRVQGNGEDWLFFLSYKILWQGVGEQTTPYVFIVLENMQSFDKEIAGFRNSLWGWLLVVVVVLVLVQAAIMSWGLKPLNNLAEDLTAIEDGKEEYLQGEYPAEIDGVTRNLNLLLSSERQQREKYRTTLADLAHSLKTPLAILQGAPAENLRETLDEQIPRMNEIVSYQLQRAVTKSASLIRKSIEVKPVVDKLVAAISRVYEDKSVEIESTIMECNFFGDERDLMELLGNVLDNACKYGNGRVKLAVGTQTGTAADLHIIVEDDGGGIAMGDRNTALLRGERLDTKTAGQGIGLAVVSEIVDRYGGEIEVDDSILGGARVTIKLT